MFCLEYVDAQANLSPTCGHKQSCRKCCAQANYFRHLTNTYQSYDLRSDHRSHSRHRTDKPTAYIPVKKRQSLRKHTYSNILKILQPQKETIQIKKSDICHISSQNIDCSTR